MFVTFGKTIITFGNFSETRKNKFSILQRRHLFLKRIQQSQLLWEVTAENGECDFGRISFFQNFCSTNHSNPIVQNFCSKLFRNFCSKLLVPNLCTFLCSKNLVSNVCSFFVPISMLVRLQKFCSKMYLTQNILPECPCFVWKTNRRATVRLDGIFYCRTNRIRSNSFRSNHPVPLENFLFIFFFKEKKFSFKNDRWR